MKAAWNGHAPPHPGRFNAQQFLVGLGMARHQSIGFEVQGPDIGRLGSFTPAPDTRPGTFL